MFVKLSLFCSTTHSRLYDLYAFCKVFTSKILSSPFCVLLSNYCLLFFVFVVLMYILSENVMSANSGLSGRGGKSILVFRAVQSPL